MITTEVIDIHEAWGEIPDTQVSASFEHRYYLPVRIYAPARFLRLLYGGTMSAEGFEKNPSNVYGWYWFAEDDILDIKDKLAAGLRESNVAYGTFSNRMGFALRDQLRRMLAICHDWSPRFDFVARLTLPPQKSVVGLVGKAQKQSPYSERDPNHEKADTILPGGLSQYALRFDVPANEDATNWIQDGIPFNSFCR